LVGKANCGKSFLIRPLEKVFRALVNPAQNSFSFAEIDGKEVVVLDDFRFSNSGKPIPWASLLLLLDGGTVSFSLPRTHYTADVVVPASNTIPVICTGKGVPEYFESGQLDRVETEMMRTRFRVFVFHKQIPLDRMRECKPCARCFVDMLHAHAPQLQGTGGNGASSSSSL